MGGISFKVEIGSTCSMNGGKMIVRYWCKSQKEREH
jgi:hypothetical protein